MFDHQLKTEVCWQCLVDTIWLLALKFFIVKANMQPLAALITMTNELRIKAELVSHQWNSSCPCKTKSLRGCSFRHHSPKERSDGLTLAYTPTKGCRHREGDSVFGWIRHKQRTNEKEKVVSAPPYREWTCFTGVKLDTLDAQRWLIFSKLLVQFTDWNWQ